MTRFRGCSLFLLILTFLTAAATAQVVGTGAVGSGGNLVCTANVANPTQARAEGHAELLGDIVIACTGGTAPAIGAAIPTANITVTLANTYVTSRILGSNGLSEALLLIDEPNSWSNLTGILPTLCTAPGGGASTSGAGVGGCAVVVGTATLPTPVTPTPGGTPITSTLVPVLSGTSTAITGGPGVTTVPNMFQGIVPSGSNQVIFNGIPILAPVTAGFARVFRITNIRASAAQLGGGGTFQGTTSILAGITISNGLLVQSPVLTAANVFTGLSTSVRNANNTGTGSSITGSGSLAQCGSNTSITGASVLRFTEGFASAFKTRIAPAPGVSGAGVSGNSTLGISTFTQNVPGNLYAGSESGFIMPVTGGIAGLADFGTRLKATFNNIPTGVRVWVSTSNILVPGGTANTSTSNNSLTWGTFGNLPMNNTTSLIAGLVIGETAGLQGVGGGQTGFLPLAIPTNNVAGGAIQVVPLTADANGTATAVWEVLNSNPAATESLDFAVYYTYVGNQVAGTPQITPAGTVALSFAPTVSTYNGSPLIPRFAPAGNSSTLITVAACSTQLSVALTSSANPANFGQTVTLTAIVSGTGGGTPTGSVAFRDGTSTLGTVVLSSGKAVFSTSALAGGTHILTAAYGGDSFYGAASSAAVSQVINTTSSTAMVLVDASHDLGVWWYPQVGSYDPGLPHQGKALADFLRSRGITVTELPAGATVTATPLSQYPLVIRAGAGTHSPAEIAAYNTYVSNGGHLILLSEHHGETDALARNFGLDFRGVSTGVNVIDSLAAHPITAGVGPIYYGVGSGLFAAPPTATLLGFLSSTTFIDLNENGVQDPGEPGSAPVMGVMPFGFGRIFFMGDTNTLEAVPLPLVMNLLSFMGAGTGPSISLMTSGNVVPGQSSTLALMLSTPAGPNGVPITLVSSDPTIVMVTPSAFVFPGQTTPDRRQPLVTGLRQGQATITVSAPGYPPATITLTVTVGVAFSQSSIVITGTSLQARPLLTLSAPAPSGGLTINLRSDNPNIAAVPATVFVGEGQLTVAVPLSPIGVGATVIHASVSPFVGEAVLNVTVTP